MHLIVGLGNPGSEYAGNRHNIGAMAVDGIARRHGFSPFKAKFQGLIADGNVDGERVLLLKPQTYMNRSGDSVAAAANFYKIPVEDVTVIYDELDLAPGKMRVKTGGGTGGHNGLRSIDPQIGNGFQRVRLGIGHPGHKELVTRHVLADFAKADQEWLAPLLDAVADNAGLLARHDANNFMNRVALALNNDNTASAPANPSSPEAAPTPRPTEQTEQTEQSEGGPMSDMLKKLFGKK